MHDNESLKLRLERMRHRIHELEDRENRQAERLAKLQESEERYRWIFENANDGIVLHDLEGRMIDVNRAMHERLGYSKSEIMALPLERLVTPEFAEKIRERVSALKAKGVDVFESSDLRKDGTAMPVEVSAHLIEMVGRPVILSMVRDIQDRALAEELITLKHRENALLLEEIQQRIRFNASVYTDILKRLARSSGPDGLAAELDAARRDDPPSRWARS